MFKKVSNIFFTGIMSIVSLRLLLSGDVVCMSVLCILVFIVPVIYHKKETVCNFIKIIKTNQFLSNKKDNKKEIGF